MAFADEPKLEEWFADKKGALRILAESDARTGFVFDPAATPEEVRELMLAQGIRPEDNVLSRDIIRVRYEDEK
jgi:hypothetical protein